MKLCIIPEGLDKVANRAGLRAERDMNGNFRVKDRDTGAFFGEFATESAAKDAINAAGRAAVPDLDAAWPIMYSGEALAADLPYVQTTVGPFRERLAALRATTFRLITPMRAWARDYEKVSGAPVYERIVKPLDDAHSAANNVYAERYSKALHSLDEDMLDFSVPRRDEITLYESAFNKDEIAAGFLPDRPISASEIQIADNFAKLGQGHDIPSLMGLSATIDMMLGSRQHFIEQELPRIAQGLRDERIPQEIRLEIEKALQASMASPGVEKNWAEVAVGMGLGQEKLKSLTMARALLGKGENWTELKSTLGLADEEVLALTAMDAMASEGALSIPAIIRHAPAPAAVGGMTGKALYASMRGFTPAETAFAERRTSLLRGAFSDYGKDYDRLVGMQLPVFRTFMERGIFPGKNFMDAGSSPVREIAKALGQMDEATALFSKRILSGSLDVRDLSPSISAMRYVRNLVLGTTFDPKLPEAYRVAKTLKDPEARRIIEEHIAEMEGKPDISFQRLNQLVKSTGRLLGVPIGENEGANIVNLLTRMAYQASIPFRAALVARNWMQSPLFLTPIVGPDYWWKGVKFAMEDGAMEKAIKAGALDLEALPLHGATEVFGIESRRLGERLGGPLARLNYKAQEAFGWGFQQYRKADDWGRVVAFGSGRSRVKDSLNKYMASTKDYQALERLLEDAKVKTFDETVEREFRDLIARNSPESFEEAANLVGKELADKVHFLYKTGNHPVGWNGVKGRLLGQFGTFPAQYLRYLEEGVTRGTTKDKAQFIATHSSMNLAIVGLGAELGFNLENWASFPSVTYTGGPYADLIVNLVQYTSGSEAERRLAKRSLNMLYPTWDHPRSMFVPGSYFVADVKDAFSQDTFLKQVLRASGIKELDPGRLPPMTKFVNEWISEIP